MKKHWIIVFLVSAISISNIAQVNPGSIPLDKKVKVGKLPNGITYYIRKNAKPENRAELRLVVNAGSIQEREDQQGIAHFLEHMAFNGTKNFPKDALLNYLQKAGVRFGADLNAGTNFDYTVYMLPIPSNDAGILSTGYQVLRDWAGNMSLDPEEIEKERGVIIEEKRMRQNAGQRMYAQYLPSLTNNSLYGRRIPIGKEEIIKTAPRKVFADFYRDWYRPNNMAVMVVGDVDIAAAEAKIKTLFSDLKNPPNAPRRVAVTPINWHAASKAKIVADAENTNSTLSVYFNLMRKPEQATWQTYEQDLLNQFISDLFGGRLEENFVNPKSPVSYAGISPEQSFLKGYNTASAFALVKDHPADALKMMTAEIMKAKQYGFTQAELDRVKKNFQKRFDEALLEKDKTESARYVDEYVEHFLDKTPAPGIEAEHQFVTSFVNRVTVTDINKLVEKFDLGKPVFMVYTTSDTKKNNATEQGLVTAFEEARLQKVTAYEEKKTSGQLMEVFPTPGKITATNANAELGSQVLTLSNGIKVIYKKTDFKNDEIIFRGTQWGGASNLTDAEIKVSKYISLVSSMGLGKNKAVDMPKVLTGVDANVFMNVLPGQLSFFGNASAKDFEKFLQLLHLRLTNVNFDAEEFEGIRSNFGNQIGGLLKNPAFKFSDTLNKYRFNNSSRLAGFPLADELNALSLDDLKKLYQKITANLNGTVFVFSGNINEQSFGELVEKYIGSIATKPEPVALNKENLLQPITGKNSFSFKAGKENKSEINHSLYGKLTEVSGTDVLNFNLLSEILQMQATKKLREEMGNTYSPKVGGQVTRLPFGDYNLSLTVSSLPENADKIVAAFNGLVDQVIKGEWDEEELKKAKAQRIKVLETAIKTNNYWAVTLEQQHLYNYDTKIITDYAAKTEVVTKADVTNAAKRFFSNCNVLKAVMNPE